MDLLEGLVEVALELQIQAIVERVAGRALVETRPEPVEVKRLLLFDVFHQVLDVRLATHQFVLDHGQAPAQDFHLARNLPG